MTKTKIARDPDDLKPCICKGSAVIDERQGNALEPGFVRVRCEACGATGSKHYFIPKDKDQGQGPDAERKRKHAIYVWDMRLSHAAGGS